MGGFSFVTSIANVYLSPHHSLPFLFFCRNFFLCIIMLTTNYIYYKLSRGSLEVNRLCIVLLGCHVDVVTPLLV